ncbi:MAG: methionyl-tRNA formyltransferase [Deltaproteobacteria bacterium]
MARILFFGQARFGAAVLDGLLAAGHEPATVCVPPRSEGDRPEDTESRAGELGLPVLARRSYKGEDALAETAADTADLGVLAFVTQIIPAAILDGPRLGSVCFHPSMLPRYRGGSAVNWQLINGETEGGITVFRPDDGIDSGPVYLQSPIAIGPDDSAGSYYYGRVFEPGVKMMLDATELVLAGIAASEVQDESLATHDPLCRDEHAAIVWDRPSKALHDLVRGCDPSPGAHSMAGPTMLRLYGSRRPEAAVEAAGSRPGTVLSIEQDGMRVATADGSLVFAKLRGEGRKGPAGEVATELGLEAGQVLGGGG